MTAASTLPPVRIASVNIENVKRIVAFAHKPDGSMLVIGGKNGQGKSSVIDAIWYALGGATDIPDVPLRRGAERGHVEIGLGDYIVRRTFTAAGGGQLTVTNREGARYPSPQKFLTDLVGAGIACDPVALKEMDGKRQLEMLRRIVGVDFSDLDLQRQRLYEERTAVNRTVGTLSAQLAGKVHHEDAPEEDVSVAALMAELDAAADLARAAALAKRAADEAKAATAGAENDLIAVDDEIDELEDRLSDARTRRASIAKQRDEVLTPAANAAFRLAEEARAAVPDTAPVRERIASADDQNRKRRENLDREACAADLDSAKAESDRLTGAIEAIDGTKRATLAAASFPVPGLSFDDSGVTFDGLPIDQASSAEQLRIFTALGLALSPRLKLVLIRDGSLLDEDSLRMVGEMAEEAGGLVIVERVSLGDECSLIIEDGHIRADEEPAREPGLFDAAVGAR